MKIRSRSPIVGFVIRFVTTFLLITAIAGLTPRNDDPGANLRALRTSEGWGTLIGFAFPISALIAGLMTLFPSKKS